MTLGEALIAVWRQALVEQSPKAEVDGRTFSVGRTRNMALRSVSFTYDGQAIDGIEQNPQTRSRWAELARGGSQIMQFSYEGRYIGNVCDGVLKRYPAWKAAGLPE